MQGETLLCGVQLVEIRILSHTVDDVPQQTNVTVITAIQLLDRVRTVLVNDQECCIRVDFVRPGLRHQRQASHQTGRVEVCAGWDAHSHSSYVHVRSACHIQIDFKANSSDIQLRSLQRLQQLPGRPDWKFWLRFAMQAMKDAAFHPVRDLTVTLSDDIPPALRTEALAMVRRRFPHAIDVLEQDG
jgi:hypothetical protein